MEFFKLQRLGPRRLYPFEALAEIFDFVAGFVQRVPKKTNKVKSDLQNSTASQDDCNWEIVLQIVLKEGSHPERRRWSFNETVEVEWV
ncbi:hypothetical protein HMPREF9225_0959 [Peptoniphilus duerdenii ATCC BAA-1640]|uniref:Uncharacterized protein n=1 Tax=Peptoniphilus duerdenii ATCC BAA-1640 TaxID=862517 RepID=E0NLC0_9FIRM|nr:hypothetical protein HMPREF9225_0959 [Peptoniphilus duerdenii ATCC BAA-1640]